ncbi:hypothetical protein [Curtobacterium sp. MCBD17_021]|uniref:hypothetical protein n=1 Tax=Curtobacterium sp. MCBD17_021 TaxID=2175665 RepID=UPI0015E8EA05|nr:hypothetical protein [Curtobacterium sp. MCBD17_021]
MSTYETEPSVEPAKIPTVARARKQWRRQGIDSMSQPQNDFFRDDAPEVVQRRPR